MKLTQNLEFVDMGNEIVAVPVGGGSTQVQGVLKLNKEGQEIIDLLQNETTEEEIIDLLASKYENDRPVLAEYVHKTITILENAGLIER